ncbi:MAG: LacI family DNA-binding transcriptional regulator [Anaerolineaceae bacterium]|jgi:LacI family transcriptional regulator|nr:LacI family DNA-binding transcriptional regulator [Anaerolineaceae bacterium]
MSNRITSQDVANLAGVSRTTVSFVLNDDKRFAIRPETAEKVRAAARQLGYYPNASARALASNLTKNIGLIVSRAPQYVASDPFLPQILSGLLDALKQNSQGLLLEWVEPGQQLQTYLELTRAHHIDGMILMTPRLDDPGLRALEEADIPVVLMGYIPGSSLHSVDVDNRGAAETAVNHLLELGHTKIACITNAALPYTSASQRLDGYKIALQKADIVFNPALVREADFDIKSGYIAMKSLLESAQEFTAVFVASDNVALGVYSALGEAGLSIPDDVSVVGFDDIPLASFVSPTLTSVAVSGQEIAIESYNLLTRLMRGDLPESRSVTLSTRLIPRQSSREIGRSPRRGTEKKSAKFVSCVNN